jgi:hypothetical protein
MQEGYKAPTEFKPSKGYVIPCVPVVVVDPVTSALRLLR